MTFSTRKHSVTDKTARARQRDIVGAALQDARFSSVKATQGVGVNHERSLRDKMKRDVLSEAAGIEPKGTMLIR